MMLTARSEETDRVLGLDLGADDYVTKPFFIQEVLARVRALLRRTQSLPAADVLSFDDVTVDFQKFEATRSGQPVGLTRKEFGVLRRLTSLPGHVFSREALLNDVWGYERYPTTRTVDNHIASLRAKLEEDPASPRRIVTVHGVGYKFVI
jgi:DNA-binding response OmpR family regulator